MKPSDIYALVACECSQHVTLQLRLLGVNAFSCDVAKARSSFIQYHINADVSPYLQGETFFYTQDNTPHRVPGWNLIIAHPPCTFLSKAGATSLYKVPGKPDPNRLIQLKAAAQFFRLCLNAKCDYLAVENPVQLKIAQLPPPTTYIQPTWFGVPYTKKTCLWLKNLPPLMPEKIVAPRMSLLRHTPSNFRRSETFPNVARAMASQWVNFIINSNQNANG